MHVVPSLDQEMGGSVQAALLISDALVRMGIDSSIRTTIGPSDRVSWIDDEFAFVSYQAFRRQFPHHYYRAPALRQRVNQDSAQCDVLHVHGVFNFPAAYALATAHKHKATIILSPHGQLDPYDLRRHRLAKSLYARTFLRRALAEVGTTVVTSDREGAMLQTFGVPMSTRTIGLPVRPLVQGSGVRLRERFGISPDAVVVLFLGRIAPKKRVDLILESVANLRSRLPALHTLVIGDGEQAHVRELRALSVALGEEPFTTWGGTLRGQDKADAFDASNVFALPSENENFGITIVEALLAGVPALVSDRVYLDDDPEGQGLATVCQPTVESCTSALLDLVRDPVTLKARSQVAQTVARDLFDPAKVAGRLIETYESALETCHGP